MPGSVQLLWFHEKSVSIPHHTEASAFTEVVYHSLKSLVAKVPNWQVLDSIFVCVRAPPKPTVCAVGAAFPFPSKAFSGTTISVSRGAVRKRCPVLRAGEGRGRREGWAVGRTLCDQGADGR